MEMLSLNPTRTEKTGHKLCKGLDMDSDGKIDNVDVLEEISVLQN
jgi:hypothetical protein